VVEPENVSNPADAHDLDKLARWRRSLSEDGCCGYPVSAIFLVSERDRAAHGIFRRFRSSFEALGAAFHHLVIFGQHGASSTVRGLSKELGLDPESLPSLVLYAGPSPPIPSTPLRCLATTWTAMAAPGRTCWPGWRQHLNPLTWLPYRGSQPDGCLKAP
jgi:hypothetical protein